MLLYVWSYPHSYPNKTLLPYPIIKPYLIDIGTGIYKWQGDTRGKEEVSL